MPSLDIVTSQSSFRTHIGAPRAQLLLHGKPSYIVTFEKEKKLGSAWKDYIQLPREIKFKSRCLQQRIMPLIRAVATVEPNCLVHSDDGYRRNCILHYDLNSQVSRTSNEATPEMDDRERLRRMKISKANKGNVPWNKGRKHSEETLRRIRERTKIAMQDPKVKMKLANIGHAQSEETRIKIGAGVREGWQRRRERLMVQETCCLEWQNMIAEASRKGYNGEDELQWDSYKILEEKLKKEWLESIEKRKTMPRPKGSKRAPKSSEQRRKISEAISAKWADPGYRDRVCTALAKYHGIPVGAERKRRRRPTGETQSAEWGTLKKKSTEPKGTNYEIKGTRKAIPKKKKNATPSYKDPMASSKLEMIKKIRVQRAAMETKKREATERAKLLIAEAEKAANALEVAAQKSPLARASLLETRKLIAEATRSIASIESGQLISQESRNNISFNWEENHFHVCSETPISSMSQEERQVNGAHFLSSSESNGKGFYFDKLTLQNSLNEIEPFSGTTDSKNLTGFHDYPSSLLHPSNMSKHLDGTDLQVGLSDELNGSVNYEKLSSKGEEKGDPPARKTESTIIPATKMKKKWVCGRLVEVEEN